MSNDAQLMEESLIAVADSGIEIRHALFDRFFEAFPDRRATFYNLEASGRRMTDETVQMMFGLASGETWVAPLVAELTFTHRSYGYLPNEEYAAFVAMTVDQIAAAARGVWGDAHELAWRRHADALVALILHHRSEWTRIMPGAVSAPTA